MNDLRATVVICTRNRAQVLGRALESFTQLRVPAGTRWEVLVVDNGSTDDTPASIARYGERLPLRATYEPEPGLSHARNRAVAEARGEYLIWIDDDAVPRSEWLTEYLSAFDTYPNAAIFGGPIDVAFDGQLPAWFAEVLPRVAPLYGQRELGNEPVALTATEDSLPFGGNFATRATEQRRYAYDTSLGRHPAHPHRGSEESKVILDMLRAGSSGRWLPHARVTHRLDASRASTTFIAEHSRAYGVFRAEYFPYPGTRVAGAPLNTWWRAACYAMRYAVTRRMSPPSVWIEDLIQRSEAFGNVTGLRAGSHAPTVTTAAYPLRTRA